MPRSAAMAERLVICWPWITQIGFGVAVRNPGACELRRDDVLGLLPPVVQKQREVIGDGFGLVGDIGGQ